MGGMEDQLMKAYDRDRFAENAAGRAIQEADDAASPLKSRKDRALDFLAKVILVLVSILAVIGTIQGYALLWMDHSDAMRDLHLTFGLIALLYWALGRWAGSRGRP